MKIKVDFFDSNLRKEYLSYTGILTGLYTYITYFWDIPEKYKNNWKIAGLFTLGLIILYIFLWVKANNSEKVTLNIHGSNLEVKLGNIFDEQNLKVIGFNEYFDTIVDDKIISSTSLNGQVIKNKINISIDDFDEYISKSLNSRKGLTSRENKRRKEGKSKKYPLGTIIKYDDYLFTALSKFDDDNRAYLFMKDYIDFFINFWNELDIVYAQNSVSIPLLGSGITRFKEYIDITDQELLEIMIWSFKISRIKFNYPSKVSIIIDPRKKDKINFYKLKELE